jgi:hypothetical protein
MRRHGAYFLSFDSASMRSHARSCAAPSFAPSNFSKGWSTCRLKSCQARICGSNSSVNCQMREESFVWKAAPL